MSLSHTTSEPPPKEPRSAFVALGWGLACAACAGGVWVGGFLILDERIELTNGELKYRFPTAAILIAFAGAFGAVLGALLVGLLYAASTKTPKVLALGGSLMGIVGGVFTIPTVIVCREWVSPLASSAILWTFIGFFAGLRAYRLSQWRPEPSKREAEGEEPTDQLGARYQQVRAWIIIRLLPLLAILGLTVCQWLTILTTRY